MNRAGQDNVTSRLLPSKYKNVIIEKIFVHVITLSDKAATVHNHKGRVLGNI